MELKLNMGFLKPVTGFFKKYIALLPSIAITVVAVLLFLPTMLVGNSVKKEMEKSARTASSVRSEISNKVPSKDQPAQYEEYMNKLDEEATRIENLAIESTRRQLVSYDIFPEPSDSSSQLFTEYGNKYRTKIESLIKAINALDAPSDAEIRSKTGTGAANRRTRSLAVNSRTQVDTQDPVVNALCMTRAQEVSVYANPQVFAWYDFWGQNYTFEGQKQALEDCWDSQVALWIYQDVIDTIQKMNGTKGQVASSPIKRLLGVSFYGPVVVEGSSNRRTLGRAVMTGMRDIPVYIKDMTPSPFMTVSPTYRKSDEDVDVTHFAVSVLVDNRHVLNFMKELCSEKQHTYFKDFDINGEEVTAKHNQITVLQSDMSIIDKEADENALYRYGNGAVVRLDLVCEYIFYRKGYDSIKPAPIKARLGQEDDAEQTDKNAGLKGGPLGF